MKILGILFFFFLTTTAFADISLFTGRWSGKGRITINGQFYDSARVELDWDIANKQVAYEDRFRFNFHGQDILMRSKIKDVTFLNNEFYSGDTKIGELFENTIHSDYTTANGTRQILNLKILNEQLLINKEITPKSGATILESAVLTRISAGSIHD